MSEEFDNSLNGTHTDTEENVQPSEEGYQEEQAQEEVQPTVNFTMKEAPKSEETQEKSTGSQAEGISQENPVPQQPGSGESSKEEWYEKEQKKNYSSYQFTSPIPPEPDKKSKKQSKDGLGRKLGTAAAAAAVFGLVAGVVFQATNFVGDKINPQTPVTPQVEKTQTTGDDANDTISTNKVSGDTGASVAQVAKNAMPSIVSIVGVSVQEIPDIYKYYFGFGQDAEETQSSGSGIIVGQNDTELLIATNNHVVSGTDSLSVCFTNQDGSAVTTTENLKETSSESDTAGEDAADSAVAAQIKGMDADNDLAVISVKLADIPEDILNEIKVAAIGDSDSLQMGDQVVAIGNALGYGQSVTSGYVSALNRVVNSENADSSFIQTDAAINPGNSGGALLNMKGELVGINSSKIASNEVEGVGFAIPISTAEPILDDLMSKETRYKVEDEDKASYMGIVCITVTDEAIQMYGMPQGVFISSLEENGPAAVSGIQNGDVILKIDGTSVSTKEELVERLEYYAAGEEVEFIISRANNGEYEEQTVKVTLGAKKDAQAADSQKQKKSR